MRPTAAIRPSDDRRRLDHLCLWGDAAGRGHLLRCHAGLLACWRAFSDGATAARQPYAAPLEQPRQGVGGVCCPRRCNRQLARRHWGEREPCPYPRRSGASLGRGHSARACRLRQPTPAALTPLAGPNTGAKTSGNAPFQRCSEKRTMQK